MAVPNLNQELNLLLNHEVKAPPLSLTTNSKRNILMGKGLAGRLTKSPRLCRLPWGHQEQFQLQQLQAVEAQTQLRI
jgi:hypothetical protein